jgi:MFS family permease
MWADRRGSRGIAVAGMLVSAVGLAGMTMLEVDTSFWWTGTWLAVVGVGSGMFNSPNTAAMMGVVAPVRRGIAAGARVMLQNTGAVLSIAALIAIVTTGVPKDVMFSIFSGLTSGLDSAQLDPFIRNMHEALWVLAGISVLGAVVSWMRPRHEVAPEAGHVEHPTDEAIGDLVGAPGFGGDAAGER